MTFLLRDFFESLIIIFFGGIFIFIDVLLGARKNTFNKTEALRSAQFLFRLVATFLFTLAAILTGKHLHHFLWHFPHWEHPLIFILVAFVITLLISFFGIIIPRFLAESDSSCGPVRFMSQLAQHLLSSITPFVSLLDFIGRRMLSFFGLSFRENHAASEEEVIQMMDEGLHAGVFNASEREMVEGVLELDEQTASSLMTPRSHVVFLDLDDEDENNWRRIISSGHSEFPVFQKKHDTIVGIVSVKALWANLSLAGSAKLRDLITPPLYVFPNMTASKIIEEFRLKKHHTALVVDEFGVIEGIITLKDVIESILGMLPEREVKGHYPEIKKQKDGSFLVDAMLHYQEARQKLKFPQQEEEEESRYQTIGGFFLHHLGHIPRVGETITIEGFRMQVFSMNRHRIDKLRVVKIEK
ncbi:MAG: hemolysin family protein [Chthoniobacterales bacterium]